MYEVITNALHENNAMVYTKYKNVNKKVKLAARLLPTNSEHKKKEVSEDPYIRHTFTKESVKKLH